jgi:hypothetical protein
MKSPLRLPLALVVAVVAGAGSCGDGHGETSFCVPQVPEVDAGSPTAPDACGQTVNDPQDCPQGCEPEGFA